jgi:hypothetical protein
MRLGHAIRLGSRSGGRGIGFQTIIKTHRQGCRCHVQAYYGLGRGTGVGRVLGIGLVRGVGVGRGVAVGVGVGVAVGVGVGVGVPPPAGAWTATVIGDPVLKKSTVAFVACGG